ncbi:MAG: CpsD/CapB family tyrosine-protein kinase [Planctomycetota bacterium]
MVPPRKQSEQSELPPPDPEATAVPSIEAEELVVATDPISPLAEHYRRLRQSIESLNPDGAPRTLMMSSALPNEGKTVASLNLALTLVERPRTHVLVLEADLRRPSLEDYLGMERTQGMSDLLVGRLGLDRAIRSTSEPGLDVIGAGSLPENPSKVLRVDRIKQVLHALKQRYDYVIVDSPPAHTLTDSAVIGSVVDGIVIVVKLGSTPRHVIDETIAQFETSGGNVMGMCLLGARLPKGAYDTYGV